MQNKIKGFTLIFAGLYLMVACVVFKQRNPLIDGELAWIDNIYHIICYDKVAKFQEDN